MPVGSSEHDLDTCVTEYVFKGSLHLNDKTTTSHSDFISPGFGDICQVKTFYSWQIFQNLGECMETKMTVCAAWL